EHFVNAANRILLPLADVEPIYRTRLEVDPGDIEAEGDVTIQIRIRGERPDVLTITREAKTQPLPHSTPLPAAADLTAPSARGRGRRGEPAVRRGQAKHDLHRAGRRLHDPCLSPRRAGPRPPEACPGHLPPPDVHRQDCNDDRERWRRSGSAAGNARRVDLRPRPSR